MLQMHSVSKSYLHRGKRVVALDEATLEIPRGQFVAIVGPSGSGKSTLMLMLGGMLSPSSGKVLVEGRSLYDLAIEERAALRRKKIGFVFQTFNLIPYLSALDNVQVPLYLAGLDEEEQRKKAQSLLERFGLGQRTDHKPAELSVGQQQRVALARMLANEPSIIFEDEPTGNLDPEMTREILDFLRELHQEGRTIVMVTHDRKAAGKAERTLTLKDGRIAEA